MMACSMLGHAVEVFRKLEFGTGESGCSFIAREKPGKLVRIKSQSFRSKECIPMPQGAGR